MDEKEAEARPLMGTIFLVIMQFTLLITLANQHPPIIVGNRNKPLYCKVPDSLSESLARARLSLSQDLKVSSLVSSIV